MVKYGINTKIFGKSGRYAGVRAKRLAFAYLMLLPAVVSFAVFYVWINFNSIVMGFKVFDGYGPAGETLYRLSLDNFRKMFIELGLKNSDMYIGLINTLKYFGANLLITLPLSYLSSYFLYKKLPGYKFFRVVFFLPSIISALVYVTVFRNILLRYGPVDTLWEALFNKPFPTLLTDEKTATNTIVFYTVWTGFGVNLLLYQGAMTRIPQEVIESVRLDGAGWAREMFRIVTPMIWPTLSTTVILSLSTVFSATGPILLFSDVGSAGGAYGTTTVSYWLFQQTWMSASLEYPAAVGVFFTIVSLPIVLAVRRIFTKIDPEVEY